MEQASDATPTGSEACPAALILSLQLAVFWPVWRWYAARLRDGSDEPWGLLALATALVFLVVKGRPGRLSRRALGGATLLTALYIAACCGAPPLVRALPAVAALACTLQAFYLRRGAFWAVLGLLCLSLPLIASLQFFAGYPMRVVTAELAALLLAPLGQRVTAQGTLLQWRGELIAVDAPCAGVHMLWCGLYWNFTLACLYELDARRTWMSYSAAAAVIFAANVLRTVLLFCLEAGIWRGRWSGGAISPGHEAIGLLTFAGAAAAILLIHRRLHRPGAAAKHSAASSKGEVQCCAFSC